MHSNISIHILLIILFIFSMVLTRETVMSSFRYWSISLFFWSYVWFNSDHVCRFSSLSSIFFSMVLTRKISLTIMSSFRYWSISLFFWSYVWFNSDHVCIFSTLSSICFSMVLTRKISLTIMSSFRYWSISLFLWSYVWFTNNDIRRN